MEVLDPPADNDIRSAAVAAAIIPPGRQEDATLNLPAQRLIKSAPATVDGQVGGRQGRVQGLAVTQAGLEGWRGGADLMEVLRLRPAGQQIVCDSG